MDETTSDEDFPGNNKEVPPSIVECLPTIDEELPLAREEEKLSVGEEELYPAKDEKMFQTSSKFLFSGIDQEVLWEEVILPREEKHQPKSIDDGEKKNESAKPTVYVKEERMRPLKQAGVLE
ncbi:unnamed protein product [Calypogeia fissa]